MKIVVLAGGLSTERDVSFVTGSMVSGALKNNGHKVILLDVFMGYGDTEQDMAGIFEKADQINSDLGGITEQAPDLEAVRKMRKDQSANFFGPNVIEICRQADIVFLALHGSNGEDGRIQAAFDLFGIRYTGSGYLGSGLAMNKSLTKKVFQQNHVPTPNGFSIHKGNAVQPDLAESGVGFPCVVKPCCGGSSIGVSVVKNADGFQEALKDAFCLEDEVVVESYVEGREFAVGVVGGKALPVIEIAPVEGFYDYKNKYKAGSAVETCPAAIPLEIAEKMQSAAVAAFEALELAVYARMDFLLDSCGNVYCLEANTLPGMTSTSLLPQEAAADGIPFGELCEMLIEISLEKYEVR